MLKQVPKLNGPTNHNDEWSQQFKLVVITPPGLPDPSLAIAASRAGGLGILDLEYTRDIKVSVRAIRKMAAFAKSACGVKLNGDHDAFITAIKPRLTEGINWVVLTPGKPSILKKFIKALHHRNKQVILEVTSLDQARLGQRLGVDGLLAKGNEAAGFIYEKTSFILLQQIVPKIPLPIWIQGGIGLHTAAACYAAGAAGIVLDSQLALTRESPLPEHVKKQMRRMDGSETLCVGDSLGVPCRIYARPGSSVKDILLDKASSLKKDHENSFDIRTQWHRVIQDNLAWNDCNTSLWLLGQDVALATLLAERYGTVGSVLQALRQSIHDHIAASRSLAILKDGSPLAQSHGTRYPIVQGPMARVSDMPAFAYKVAQEGGLPFIAMAWLHGEEAEAMLRETKEMLKDRPWGVGLLGFVPAELYKEQLKTIKALRPPFVLIAGGRPDQADVLEKEGIPTYLHVPSPGLLKMFLENGVRRFVFEGRESGGHVGPLCGFVLWEMTINVLLEFFVSNDRTEECHVLFAGGIHDALSSSMVAAMAAPLAECGVRVGVQLGSAYLFTQEAVTTGAIVQGYQQEVLQCDQTTLLETGTGHANRCANTPYAKTFTQKKQWLSDQKKSQDEIRKTLEEMTRGRLRIASKGIVRNPNITQNPRDPKFLTLNEEQQHNQGMYMIGQLASLNKHSYTIKELHHTIAFDGSRKLEELPMQLLSPTRPPAKPSRIAIIGLSCFLPKAKDIQAYWENILNKVFAITEIPKNRWDWELFFDPDRKTRDKIYSKWGGFIDDVPFDPVEFGMPPNSMHSIDPMQLLALKAARTVLEDAGYLQRPFDRSRTSVILGASGGSGDLGAALVLRSGLPLLFGESAAEIVSEADGILPEWTEDSFAGLLLNVAAGRITNRLDFGGMNCIVDAACASSLAAVHTAVRELETLNTDMVIVGGVDTVQNPFGYLCFSKTQALSPSGQPRTFDAGADGITISEGIVMLVLKRLDDAERDGDRIYAVIQGIGGSSDGKAMGLTAPRPEGQMLALERAYTKAGILSETVDLFEAHGTGTVVGDRTEALALSAFLEQSGAARQSCAIGSVKSMIGHTKATAGVAALAKVALALYHKILPPTLGVTNPNPNARFGEGPLYINSETRPWIQRGKDHPRRAGVSSFGFGGTNFHAVVEEYTGDFLAKESVSQHWPTELLILSARSRRELAISVASLSEALDNGARPELPDLAYTYWHMSADELVRNGGSGFRLAMVTSSLDDLRKKLYQVGEALNGSGPIKIFDPRGVYFLEEPLAQDGKLAFLFPGQGSQYTNMLRDLAVHFPEVRECFEHADLVLQERFPESLSSYVFPVPAFGQEEERVQMQALTQTNVAQPALGATTVALLHLLKTLGIKPHMVAGHSYGEYVSLCRAGVFDEDTLMILSELRGRSIMEAAKEDLGTMTAVQAGPDDVAKALSSLKNVWISNLNAPRQTMVSGTKEAVQQANEILSQQGIKARPIPVACAFHSPIVAPAQKRLSEFLSTIDFAAPQIEVFSNTTGSPYPEDPQSIIKLLSEHLVKPVRFADEVEAMHNGGARIFVEVGPRNVLTGLVQQILAERKHIAIPTDISGRPALTQLQHALAQLAAHGTSIKLNRLFEGRTVRELNMKTLIEETKEKPLSPTTWFVNGGRARPTHQKAEPPRQPTVSLRPVSQASVDGDSTAKAQGKSPGGQQPALRRPEKPASDGRTPSVQELSTPPPDRLTGPENLFPTPNGSDEDGKVILGFQQLMNRFLETQKNVMLSYLQGGQTSPDGGRQDSRNSKEFDGTGLSDPASLTTPVPKVSETFPVPAAPEPDTPQPPAAVDDSVPDESSDTFDETQLDRKHLTEQLLKLVSDRTGYPQEMLDLDVDMESDLGIDSIKRVEIFGAFQNACLPADSQIDQETMDQFTQIKTLRGVVDWVDRTLGGEQQEPKVKEAAPSENDLNMGDTRTEKTPGEDDKEIEVPRCTMVKVEAPVRSRPVQFTADRIFLVTDDERGIAQTLAEQLRERGGRVVVIKLGKATEKIGDDLYRTDLTDSVEISEFMDTIRKEYGPVGGLIHLLPLCKGGAFEQLDLPAWRDRLRRDVKSLFHLAKMTGEDLIQAGDNGKAWCMAVSCTTGISSADGRKGESRFPGLGGLSGLIKTLAVEWPKVLCRAIRLDLQNPVSSSAKQILDELGSGDRAVEAEYQGLKRHVFRPALQALDEKRKPHLTMDSDWIVLVTGGARGITAEVAYAISESYKPTLLLVGSSPLPEPKESPKTANEDSPQELKLALMEQMREVGEQVTLAKVEEKYKRLLKDREIRRTLDKIRGAGSSVRYFQVDVRDAQGMTNLIQGIYKEYGRLDGVIHGAGIIEDKLIKDKTTDSFDLVFDTKADSAFILSREVRFESLKFLVFFSSTAGTFGNRGQCDYAAANEVMNRLAVYLDQRSPGRVVSINWGPWDKTGMVSPDLKRQFEKRGVSLIPVPTGCRIFDRELRYGEKGEAVVIALGGTWDAEKQRRNQTKASLPMIHNAKVLNGSGDTIEVIRTFDPSHDFYLRDHQLDGKPVLPVAMAMELMAEIAQEGWPGLEVSGLRNLSMLKGIVLENGPKTLRLTATKRQEFSREHSGISTDVVIADSAGGGRPYYQGIVDLSEGLPEPPPYQPSSPENLKPFPMSVEKAYDKWLFHGPLYQGISKIEGFDDQGMTAILVPSSPQQCLQEAPDGQWLIDPVIFDSGLQMFILWTRARLDVTPLPSRLQRYRRFGSLSGSKVHCRLHVSEKSQGNIFYINIYFVGPDGRLLGLLEDFEGAGSKALNRLAGRHFDLSQ